MRKRMQNAKCKMQNVNWRTGHGRHSWQGLQSEKFPCPAHTVASHQWFASPFCNLHFSIVHFEIVFSSLCSLLSPWPPTRRPRPTTSSAIA